jgi:flagellar biosynthetic protein FlhB
MSKAAEDSGEKEFAATPHRLTEARRKGDAPAAQDLAHGAALVALVASAAVAGPGAMLATGEAGMAILATAGGGAVDSPALGPALAAMVWPVVPLLVVPAAAALAALVAAGVLFVASDRIAPKLSRISPVAIAAHKFGPDGLFEFAKGVAKFVLLLAIAVWFARKHGEAILGAMLLPPATGFAAMTGWMLALAVPFVAVAAVVGLVEHLWQRYRFAARNRMTRKEMMDELRDSEGDPQQKAQRRQRAQDIATRNMIAEVGQASVVIVNPVHVAVALRWARGDRTAPIVVAKGEDEVAARIRDAARKAGVPIHRDVAMARAINGTIPVGQPVRPEHFAAVAAAIRFAERVRARKHSLG